MTTVKIDPDVLLTVCSCGKKKTRFNFCSQFGFTAQTNASEDQWIDLGDLSQFSCIVKPSTCGATSGSLSVWIKLGNCEHRTGILTSTKTTSDEGFALIYLLNEEIR